MQQIHNYPIEGKMIQCGNCDKRWFCSFKSPFSEHNKHVNSSIEEKVKSNIYQQIIFRARFVILYLLLFFGIIYYYEIYYIDGFLLKENLTNVNNKDQPSLLLSDFKISIINSSSGKSYLLSGKITNKSQQNIDAPDIEIKTYDLDKGVNDKLIYKITQKEISPNEEIIINYKLRNLKKDLSKIEMTIGNYIEFLYF
jgi:hypothetical protein